MAAPPHHRNDGPRQPVLLFLLLLLVVVSAPPTLAASSFTPAITIPALQWQKVSFAPGAAVPGPRRDAVFVFDVTTSTLVLFGGRSADSIPLDDTWVLDLSAKPSPTWTLVDQNPARPLRPPARYGAFSGADVPTTSDRRGIIIALGRGAGGSVLTDAWGLHMTTMAWNPLVTTGDKPTGRWGGVGGVSPEEHNLPPFASTLVAALGSTTSSEKGTDASNGAVALTVSGVASGFNYSTVAAKWSSIALGSALPGDRTDAAGTILVGQKILAAAGCAAGACPSSDAYVASPSGTSLAGGGGSWRPVNSCLAPRRGSATAIRPDTSANVFYNQAVMFGGTFASQNDPTAADGVVAFFDGSSNSWTHVLPSSQSNAYPPQRAGISLAAHTTANLVAAFGGANPDGSLSSDVWVLSFSASNAAANSYIACYSGPQASGGNSGGSSGATNGGMALSVTTQRVLAAALLAAAYMALGTMASFVARYLKPIPVVVRTNRRREMRAAAAAGARGAGPASSAMAAARSAGPHNVPDASAGGSGAGGARVCSVWLASHVLMSLLSLVAAIAGTYFSASAYTDAGNEGEPQATTWAATPAGAVAVAALALTALVFVSGAVQPAHFPGLVGRERAARAAVVRARRMSAAATMDGRSAAIDAALRTYTGAASTLSPPSGGPNSGSKSPSPTRASAAAGGTGVNATIEPTTMRVSAATAAAAVPPEPFSYTRLWTRTHKAASYLSLALGYAAVYLALSAADATWPWYAAAAAFTVAVALAVLVLSLMQLPSRRSATVRLVAGLRSTMHGGGSPRKSPGPHHTGLSSSGALASGSRTHLRGGGNASESTADADISDYVDEDWDESDDNLAPPPATAVGARGGGLPMMQQQQQPPQPMLPNLASQAAGGWVHVPPSSTSQPSSVVGGGYAGSATGSGNGYHQRSMSPGSASRYRPQAAFNLNATDGSLPRPSRGGADGARMGRRDDEDDLDDDELDDDEIDGYGPPDPRDSGRQAPYARGGAGGRGSASAPTGAGSNRHRVEDNDGEPHDLMSDREVVILSVPKPRLRVINN
ncbi:hypothetical protein BC828DRAFT_375686 [Blastocladiella britannica]|nr:hypothetical protein BC828DRAFT_375686 [Blastocladiella britannica]